MTAPTNDGSVEFIAPRVVVIDDDANLRKALQIRLGAYGIEVIVAQNARDGAYQVWLECPDLIIVDQNMPDMSGKSLIAKLQEHDRTSEIPIVMITGQTMDGHEDWGLKREMLERRGAVAYLTKPVDYKLLFEVIGQHVSLVPPVSGSAAAGR